MIDERRPVVHVTSLGEFWRILLPGTYTLKVMQFSKEQSTDDKQRYI
jgi:hypothetical protein